MEHKFIQLYQDEKPNSSTSNSQEQGSRGKVNNETTGKTDSKKDKESQHDSLNTDAIKEEDNFEKTADELEEVLKLKFPDTAPRSSQKTATPITPTPSATFPAKPAIKIEPGII